MGEEVGKLFSILPKYKTDVEGPPWESWHDIFVIWPRRSITGKFVFGRVNRSSRDEFQVPFGVYLGDNEPGRLHRYASNKELFMARLAGEA